MTKTVSSAAAALRGAGPLVNQVLGGTPLPPGFHVGLGLGAVSPSEDSRVGTVPNKEEARERWLDALASTTEPVGYESWFKDRWKPGVARVAAREVRATSRLLVGAGDPSVFDVGLRVHHTWGVPVIPGSSLKGLVSHWLDVVYGPDPCIDVNPLDPGHAEPDRAPYRRPMFPPETSRPKYGPGEVQRVIFGAPDVADDVPFLEDRGVVSRGVRRTSCRGHVQFHDALMVPGSQAHPFAVDVLTPHHSLYQRGLLAANDYETPVPVSFLTVNRGVRFLVAVTADPGWEAWAEFALGHLCDALADWGVGAKTAAGYGRCETVNAQAVVRVTDANLKAEVKAWLAERFASLPATDDGPRTFVEEIRKGWGDRLQAMNQREREDVVRGIESFLSDLKKARQLIGRPYDAYRLAVKALGEP